MSQHIVVFGYGAVGQTAVDMALKQGHSVTLSQRSAPTMLPLDTRFAPCDVLDREAVIRAADGANQIIVAVGFRYEGNTWRACWPRAMANLIEASATHGARMIFIDNMYMDGPQSQPLKESMPLSNFGVKPAVRSEVTRLWMAAADAGRARITALRAPDFYGPGVGLSPIGDVGFGAVANGRTATLIVQPEIPHAFAYVPDIGRAVGTLLMAPDDAFGQAWHVPCAPTLTPQRILEIGAVAIGQKAKIRRVPLWMLPAAGLVSGFMREVAEMRFTFDRPYKVDSRKFAARFWGDATPFEAGATETARSFMQSAAMRAA